jgi:GT2 family glycosyltransferase
LANGASLSVSIVTFAPDFARLRETLRTLSGALAYARASGALNDAELAVVDNGPGPEHRLPLGKLLKEEMRATARGRVLSGQGNVGYGKGHNLALRASQAEFHLVLNPDVALEREAVNEALVYMGANSDVAILAPQARDASGELLHLCKRYPSVLDLLLRGFAPASVKRWFRARLERYEMRELPADQPLKGVAIVSGSFMFCRRAPIAEIGGFSDRFFLYFEDFDLSLRAAARGTLARVPSVRITHHGGNAARKGWRHVGLFTRSAVTFFNRHGWKWA